MVGTVAEAAFQRDPFVGEIRLRAYPETSRVVNLPVPLPRPRQANDGAIGAGSVAFGPNVVVRSANKRLFAERKATIVAGD